MKTGKPTNTVGDFKPWETSEQLERVVKGIFVNGSVSFPVKCEMLDFGDMKCDFFYPREALFSIKLLSKMRIDVSLVNCDSIFQKKSINIF